MKIRSLLLPFAAVLMLVVSGPGCNYNSIVAQDEQVNQAWADVQSQYQRRADLVPNLVNTVKGAANFEQTTLTQVTEARSRASSIQLSAEDLNDPAKIQQFQEAQAQLSQGLGRLLAVAENYPELKATDAFRDLSAQLEGTENRINVARDRYNNEVASYNTMIRSFPTTVYAGWFGFRPKTPFQADAGAQTAPKVDFGQPGAAPAVPAPGQ
ncbi:MAG: LemA family protein [Rhodothermales bacterium]|nr:LemA family protein [Rhodothermales bacterium]MCA0270273.1 LemA family protein [Bacteroidota bacterium]